MVFQIKDDTENKLNSCYDNGSWKALRNERCLFEFLRNEE